jgi:hypothetical protein
MKVQIIFYPIDIYRDFQQSFLNNSPENIVFSLTILCLQLNDDINIFIPFKTDKSKLE